MKKAVILLFSLIVSACNDTTENNVDPSENRTAVETSAVELVNVVQESGMLPCSETENMARLSLREDVERMTTDENNIYAAYELVMCDAETVSEVDGLFTGVYREDATASFSGALGFMSSSTKERSYRLYAFINGVDQTDTILPGNYLNALPREPNLIPINIENPLPEGFYLTIVAVEVTSHRSLYGLGASFAHQFVFLNDSGSAPELLEDIYIGEITTDSAEPNYIAYSLDTATPDRIDLTVTPSFEPYGSVVAFDVENSRMMPLKCGAQDRGINIFQPNLGRETRLECSYPGGDFDFRNIVFLIQGEVFDSGGISIFENAAEM